MKKKRQGKSRSWNLERAEPVCKAVARSCLRMFKGLRQFDYDDLLSEGIRISLEDHGRYRPGRSKYETWLAMHLRRRLIEIFRAAAADRARAERHASGRPEAAEDPQLQKARHGIRRGERTSSLVKALGKRLRSARGGKSIHQIARRSGIGESTIRRLESGAAGDVRLSQLERLALVCGSQVRDLVPLERLTYTAARKKERK